MDIFLHSTLLVTLGEIGDKTQLLAILLAARYLRPAPIILGILVATLANHALAVLVGEQIGSLSDATWMQLALAASFILLGLWVLKPDSLDAPEIRCNTSAFTATVITFFLAEMGDKTQVLTVALGAEYKAFLPVLMGTTCGMMLANLPAIFLGQRLLDRIPMALVRYAAAALFIAFGIWGILRAV